MIVINYQNTLLGLDAFSAPILFPPPRILRRRRPPRIRHPPTHRCPRPPPHRRSQVVGLGTRPASSPTCPGLRGSSSPYSSHRPPPHPPPHRLPRPPRLHRHRAPCRPASLRVVASARASTSSPRPAASAFSLTVVLPNAGRGAPASPLSRQRTPNWVLLTQTN
jgi:hypothetical protein